MEMLGSRSIGNLIEHSKAARKFSRDSDKPLRDQNGLEKTPKRTFIVPGAVRNEGKKWEKPKTWG